LTTWFMSALWAASTRLILSKAYSHCATRSPWWRILPRGPFSSSAPTPARKTNLPLPAPLTVTASEKIPRVQALWVNSFFSYLDGAGCCAAAGKPMAMAAAAVTMVAQAYVFIPASLGSIGSVSLADDGDSVNFDEALRDGKILRRDQGTARESALENFAADFDELVAVRLIADEHGHGDDIGERPASPFERRLDILERSPGLAGKVR